MKLYFRAFLFLFIMAYIGISFTVLASPKPNSSTSIKPSENTSKCLMCHTSRHAGIVADWKTSKHAQNSVGCFECHNVKPGSKNAFEGHYSFTVSPSVSPQKCAQCHQDEYKSFEKSSHALCFNLIADVASSSQVSIGKKVMFEQSCAKCHDIGRINNDGSRGNCAACHTKHSFSLAKVRSSDTCTKCHNGENGPAKRAWKHSKHGSSFDIANKNVDFSKRNFIPSNEGVRQPNCFICHLAAYSKDGSGKTHNPSDRLSWNISAIKSEHKNDWQAKRTKMKSVCVNCHSTSHITKFYKDYDISIEECNRTAISKLTQITSMTEHMLNDKKNSLVKCKLGNAMMCPVLVLEGKQEMDKE